MNIMNEQQQKQLIIYTLAYGTNIMYLILIGILGSSIEAITVDPLNALIILGIGVVISVIGSYRYIRTNNMEETEVSDIIIKLSLYHIPSLIALVGSIVYLFILN
jgi:hypothetical protein